MSASSVIVGVDGSPESLVALRWAVGFAPSDAEMIAVRAWDYPVWSAFPSPLGGYPVPPAEEMEAIAAQQLATAVDMVDREVSAEVLRGEPATTLIKRAEPDDIIVVGTRGYGAVRDWLMTSVSTGCAAHAKSTVIIVPSSAEVAAPRRVVVGIDGSANSVRAVRWALDHVAPPLPVKVMTAWDTPVMYGYDPMVPSTAAYEEAARKRLDSVSDALGGEGIDTGRLDMTTMRGDPRTVLTYASENADLLVIGSHGHGGILHLVMGSVAASMVHHPKCPLAVVRAHAEPIPTDV